MTYKELGLAPGPRGEPTATSAAAPVTFELLAVASASEVGATGLHFTEHDSEGHREEVTVPRSHSERGGGGGQAGTGIWSA